MADYREEDDEPKVDNAENIWEKVRLKNNSNCSNIISTLAIIYLLQMANCH